MRLFNVLASGAGTSGSLSGILDSAGTMFTWFITQMTALIKFVTDNPLILVMFMILLSGSVVAMFMRIWHSA